MTPVPVTLACTVSDRTRAILEGVIPIEGCEVTPLPGDAEEIFPRALRDHAFDITEMSLSSHAVVTSRGDAHYVGVPVFPSRSFRHSALYIRTDRGIEAAEDLAGKTIGIPEFQMTVGLWLRGILSDFYGVPRTSVHWRTGGLEVAGGRERIPITVREGIDLRPIPPDRTLSGMLGDGEIDGLISPWVPSCVAERRPGVGRLFPDYRDAERAFYRLSGLFPIMHLVAIRRSLLDHHPWLGVSVFNAFAEAKRRALDELRRVNFLPVAAPWIGPDLDDVRALMGDDYWPYGVAPNEGELSAVVNWSHAEGLADRLLDFRELFDPATLDLVG